MTRLTWNSVILPLSARLRAPSFLDARLERNPLGDKRKNTPQTSIHHNTVDL